MFLNFVSSAAVAATIAVAVCTPAAAQSVASQDPAAVHPGLYDVEPHHTQVGFSVSHFGFTSFGGFFSKVSGRLNLDPADPSRSSLDVSVPLSTVLTTSPELDGELQGPSWFDTVAYPVATFTSTSIERTGDGRATIAGRLTLHGVTRPIVLYARFVGAGINPLDRHYTVGFEATGSFKRSEFGVKTYVPLVGDEVDLTMAGAFEQAR